MYKVNDMRLILLIIGILLLVPTASATVTDFTVLEPFPESVVAGNNVNATVSFVSDSEPFNVTMTFTSPTPLSYRGYKLQEVNYIFLNLDDTTLIGYCIPFIKDNIYTMSCDDIISAGKHNITAGFILNPAIVPDDYHFDLTVSWLEDDKPVVRSAKKTARYSGNYVTQEPPVERVRAWSPYDDLNGNGTIHLGDPENDTDPMMDESRLPDEGQEPEDSMTRYLIYFILLVIMAVALVIRLAHEYVGGKDKAE